MDGESLESLSRRLASLEASCRSGRREARRWRLAAIALATVAAGGVLAGARTDDGEAPVVRARRFVLADAEGKPRAALGVAPTGEVSLAFLDAGGKRRASVGLRRDGSPVMLLTDAGTEAGISLSVDAGEKGGTPLLSVYDRDGNAGLQAGSLNDGTSSISLHDSRGVARLALTLRQDGEAGMTLLEDASGVASGAFAAGADGAARIFLKDRDGDVKFRAPTD